MRRRNACGANGDAVSKGPDAFRTISEVADHLDLPQHVLRFWETRFAQIKPLKRGGGRRYYRPDDVDLLRGIRQLLYGAGYTIRGVQRILHEQGQRFVVSAGKGELAGLEALAVVSRTGNGNGHGRGVVIAAPAEAALANGEDEDGEAAVEPTFDPREFRPGHALNGGDQVPPLAPAEHLSPDEVYRLQTTLSELVELKRLLDHVR
jgi:DNA-binding transcriptional MerR regulator